MFVAKLVVVETILGGTDWSNIGSGLIGALATLAAAFMTVRIQNAKEENEKRTKVKGNQLTFKNIRERDSFSALDVLKFLDLRDSPGLQAEVTGTAILIDSHLIEREANSGDGVVFCYATSGSMSGTSEWSAYEWGEIDPHSPLKHGTPAKSFALGVNLETLPIRERRRIVNRIIFRGAFDDSEAENFETHIDRNTSSITFILLFSPSYPCDKIIGEIDIGRDQWKEIKNNKPMILSSGTLVYWRVFSVGDDKSLQHLSKYRLRWMWRLSNRAEPSVATMVG